MVRLAQCLCGPARHAIFALGFEADASELDKIATALLKKTVEDGLAAHAMNPWCAICRAPAKRWVYECKPTRFRTIEEARPELKRLEAEQAAARAMFEGPGRN